MRRGALTGHYPPADESLTAGRGGGMDPVSCATGARPRRAVRWEAKGHTAGASGAGAGAHRSRRPPSRAPDRGDGARGPGWGRAPPGEGGRRWSPGSCAASPCWSPPSVPSAGRGRSRPQNDVSAAGLRVVPSHPVPHRMRVCRRALDPGQLLVQVHVPRRREGFRIVQTAGRHVDLPRPVGVPVGEGRATPGAFPHGVWFVPLATVADPALVPAAVAAVLGLRDPGGGAAIDALKDHLRPRRALLVLDNCEHLLAAAPAVADLLAAAPGLSVLATSRAALRLSGEQELPVPPLALPPEGAAGGAPDPGRLAEYEAVALFVQRAGAGAPDFALTAETAPALAAICRRLDGLPLALELAAARAKLLPPRELLARLEPRLG